MRALPLFLLLTGTAVAHPGAQAHLHATRGESCDPDVRARRLASLLAENLLKEARIEVARGRACPLPSVGAEVAEAQLAMRLGDPAAANDLLTAILEREPRHAGALVERAAARSALGQLEAAADDALVVARIGTANPSTWIGALERVAALDDAPRLRAVSDEALEAVDRAPVVRMRVAELLLPHDPARSVQVVEDLDLPRALMVHAEAMELLEDPMALHAWRSAYARVEQMRPSPKKNELLAQIAAHLPEGLR